LTEINKEKTETNQVKSMKKINKWSSNPLHNQDGNTRNVELQ